MRFNITTLVAALLALAPSVLAADKKVYAHYMLGLTSGQSEGQWRDDISAAKAAGIDGFALNAGPTDSYSEVQLANAYRAAEAAGFELFISFDMACCGAWPVGTVVNWINTYKNSRAQAKVDGKPLVSTFEGPDFANQWQSVKDQTGAIYLVPDWSSLGPGGIAQHLNKIDGAFSWDAWSSGTGPKTVDSDVAYLSTLGSKSYMMGVSPWFYTNLPVYNKNWLWNSDTLWFDRWEQVLDLQPDFVQIISWNDYGESHYISEIRDAAVIPPAAGYINGIPHSAWQFVLPYYISAYKANNRNVAIPTEGAVFWYRTTPKASGSDGGTVVGPGGNVSAREATEDAVFVLTLANADSDVTVSIGGQAQTFRVARGAKLVKMPFNGRTGDVRVVINGKSGNGPRPITAQPANGVVNFNPVVAKTN